VPLRLQPAILVRLTNVFSGNLTGFRLAWLWRILRKQLTN
jgi:hypothetical protein